MADGALIAQSAREKSPNAGAFGECKRCDKRGLPVLPLRFAYVPKDTDYRRYQVGTPGFSLEGGELALRKLSDGYLYVLDERAGGSWRAFAVTEDGQLWEFPAKGPAPDRAAFTCKRAGHTVRSSMFSIPKPDEAQRIWMAYTSVRYTDVELNTYKKACLGDDIRDESGNALSGRFQMFHVSTLMTLENSGALAQAQARAVDAEGKVFTGVVPEYDGRHARFSESTYAGRDLRAESLEIAKRMYTVRPKGGGVAVFLEDPIGIALEIRHYAKMVNAKIAAVKGKYSRQLKVDELIKQMEAAWKKGGMEKHNEWIEDYASCLDNGRVQTYRNAYKQEMGTLPGLLLGICMDTQTWMKRFTFKLAVGNDFNRDDVACCKAFTSQVGTLLAGLGMTSSERDFASAMLVEINEDNLWYRVLTANQKTLLKYLKEDKVGDVYDMFKNAYSAVDEWTSTYSELASRLKVSGGQALANAPGAAAALSETDAFFRGTLPLIDALKGAIFSLQGFISDARLASLKQTRALAMAGMLWFNTMAIPLAESGTLAEFARKDKEAVWGNRLADRATTQVDADGVHSMRMNVGDVMDELGEAAHVRIVRVSFAFGVIDGTSGRLVVRTGTLTMESVTRELQAQGAIVAAIGASENANLARLAQAAPGTNHGSETLKLVRNGGANGVLSVIAGAFQAVSLASSLGEAQKKGGVTNYAKVAAPVIGLVGAVAEFTAAGMAMSQHIEGKGIEKILLGMSAKKIAGIGGILGGAAGVITGIMTITDGFKTVSDGDNDAGVLTGLAGISMMVGGGFGIAGGIAGASGVCLGLGPAGWAVLAVGAAVVGIALLFMAEDAKDNALQTWIKSSCLGINNKYSDGAAESAAYAALFALPIKVDYSWERGANYLGGAVGLMGHVNIEVSAPNMTSNSWLEYEMRLETQTEVGNVSVGEKRAASAVPGTGLFDPAHLVNGTNRLTKKAPQVLLSAGDGGSAKWVISFSEGMLSKVVLVLRYWPDKVKNPEVVVPSAAGKVVVMNSQVAK